MLGLPEDTCGGIFTSGSSTATLMALAVARDQLLPCTDRAAGIVYMTSHTHSSAAKACRILGLSDDQIRLVGESESESEAGTSRGKMDVASLEAAILTDMKRGLRPFAVVATCSTTNTGAVDPLLAIGHLCRRLGLWMHVDGAFGASAALCESRKHLVAGIELANSVAWDAHKWLLQTYDCGMLLVADRRTLRQTFSSHVGRSAAYLEDAADDGAHDAWDYGIEMTRPARFFKLWFTFRVLGVQGMAERIEHGFRLAEVAQAEIAR